MPVPRPSFSASETMKNHKGISKEKPSANTFWQYLKKNAFSFLIGIAAVAMLVSPGAKSWVLRQIVATGIFNASIDQDADEATSQSAAVDFDFLADDGTIQNTSSLRGKVVFINFWASWCPPCRAEFPSVEALYSKFKNNPDVFFLTISEDDDPVAARSFMEKEQYSVPFYKAYGNVPAAIFSGSLPTTVVLDKSGKIRFHHERLANYGTAAFVKQIEELTRE